MQTLTSGTARGSRHAVVDLAIMAFAGALVAAVLLALPGPEFCAAMMPSPVPCVEADRQQIALITIASVLAMLGAAVCAHHLLRGPTRVGVLVVLALLAVSVTALGASSLAVPYWIIPPTYLP